MHPASKVLCLAFLLVLVSGAYCQRSRDCNRPCGFNYSPVCGQLSNGGFKQFPNRCSFDNAKCLDPSLKFFDTTTCPQN